MRPRSGRGPIDRGLLLSLCESGMSSDSEQTSGSGQAQAERERGRETEREKEREREREGGEGKLQERERGALGCHLTHPSEAALTKTSHKIHQSVRELDRESALAQHRATYE
ncbi:hypothetical protein EYF80_023641 [Liparis tanakae]|uniref:Uncharacterized protein n=1 Tax=Liparis tanakae TaxID=230148 RepID=A0A4Z2HMF5_9TELE|nr:hypothetical protein EYF80_023641 [Liparis tanakae]